jgi:hypothetical protein
MKKRVISPLRLHILVCVRDKREGQRVRNFVVNVAVADDMDIPSLTRKLAEYLVEEWKKLELDVERLNILVQK